MQFVSFSGTRPFDYKRDRQFGRCQDQLIQAQRQRGYRRWGVAITYIVVVISGYNIIYIQQHRISMD